MSLLRFANTACTAPTPAGSFLLRQGFGGREPPLYCLRHALSRSFQKPGKGEDEIEVAFRFHPPIKRAFIDKRGASG